MKKGNLLSFLLSLLIALGLWVYVVTNVSTEHAQTFSSVVILENEDILRDKNLMVLSGHDTRVSFILKGSRSNLNRLVESDLKVTADLNEIDEAGRYELSYRISYPSGMSLTLEKRLTETVTVVAADWETKTVPVKIFLEGEQADDLFVDKEGAQFSVPSVKISGPKEQVEQIETAGIVVNVEELTQTLSGDYWYSLLDKNGNPVGSDMIETDTQEIHVTLPVEYIKELPLRVELVSGGGVPTTNASVKLGVSSVMVSGSREAIDRIDELVIASVNLGEVELGKGYKKTAPLNLDDLNLTNHSGIEDVPYEVIVRGISSLTVSIPYERIQLLNVPEGYEANILNLVLDVIVRGPSAQMADITLDSLTAVVDFTDQRLGTYTQPVTITIANAPDVGIFGTYSVTVTVAPAPVVEETGPAPE